MAERGAAWYDNVPAALMQLFRVRRMHRKVLLIWNSWIAIQVVFAFELAVGFAFHWARPMLDIYLGPLTIAIGRTPVLTDMHEKLRGRCRGFIIQGTPDEALL